MATTAEVAIQTALLLLALAMVYALHAFPKRAFSSLRLRGRSTLQAKRHFVQGAQLLARARSAATRSSTISLARSASSQADLALSLDPKDAAAHILKALALDLQGHKISAVRSFDAALSPPASKSLSPRERGDALFKRAELQLQLNRRRRLDSALADLIEAVKLSPDNSKALCLLGSCYEQKDMWEDARKAYEAASQLDPDSALAREGLNRLAGSH